MGPVGEKKIASLYLNPDISREKITIHLPVHGVNHLTCSWTKKKRTNKLAVVFERNEGIAP
ncbi:hypothetical protein NC652_032869 [Populus alba x Populus x berolinensis]|nr:hypothetical protein NC652_032869 [Populus alba x Populus x berolinensis]